MTPITISRKLIKGGDLVIIPRKQYEEFLGLEKIIERKLAEESDTDLAIKIYKSERKQRKLKIVKSLADIG